MVGPVAVVLTNLNGFSAHIISTRTPPGGVPHTTSGELLGREGRLVYQPALHLKGKRARTVGGLFFIWDVTKRSGYVLSEALQGYAPIKSDADAGSLLSITKDGIQAEINGHSCHRCTAEVVLKDGLKAHVTLWQADDAEHFPVRIESANGPILTTLDFSEFRLEYPAQEIFLPPDGFTVYASSVAMMNELIIRETSITSKYQFGASDEPVPVNSGNWHQQAPPGMR